MKKIIIFCCILLIAGCGQWVSVATIPYTKIETKPITQLVPAAPATQTKDISKILYQKNYKIGEIKTAFIGQEIIKIRPYKIIEMTTTTKMKMTTKTISHPIEKIASSRDPLYIVARDKLRKFRINTQASQNLSITESIKIEDQIYDVISLPNNYDEWKWGLLIDDKGEVFKKGLYSYTYEMMFYSDYISITPVKFNISLGEKQGAEPEIESESETEAEPKIEKTTELDYSYTPYELIYSGKNNVSLNVIYREYTPNDIARTAFFQNITYQADAKNIRFKDFEIKIHSASNEKIVYTVLKDGLN